MIAANRMEIGPLVAELRSAKVYTFGKFVQKLTSRAARRADGNALRYMSYVLSPRRRISRSFQCRFSSRSDTMPGRGLGAFKEQNLVPKMC